MKATDYLRQQHDEARALIARLMDLNDPGQREVLRSQLVKALRGHMIIEEESIYPRFEDREETEELIEAAFSDHDELKEVLADFERADAEDAEFDSLLTEIEDDVDVHVAEEEEELLPRIESAWSEEELNSVGQEIQQRYDAMMAADGGELRV
jgi:hemerythrin-like domain-containing protein